MVPVGVASHSVCARVEDGRPDLDLGVCEVVHRVVVDGDEIRVGGRRRGRDAVRINAHFKVVAWTPSSIAHQPICLQKISENSSAIQPVMKAACRLWS